MKYGLLVLIILTSCSVLKKTEKAVIHEKKVAPKAKAIEVINKTIRPGEVQKIKFTYEKDVKAITCLENSIPVYREKSEYAAFVTASYWAKLEPFDCTVENNVIARFNVVDKDFPAETLNVDMKRVVLNEKDQKRVQKEQIFLNSVYRQSPDYPLFQDSFELPIKADVTSIYGSKRVFNNKKQTQHLGTDFRAPVGEIIRAANTGKVVVARDLFFTGNTVTIDHGLGIFTIYGHLSKLSTVEGEVVPKGAIIGLSGATGRVTGPHLHWGVKVNGQFIEGESLVAASKE
ncbi:MAG: hypothetical protein Fur0010_09010 [Bdellovibrio sp.]